MNNNYTTTMVAGLFDGTSQVHETRSIENPNLPLNDPGVWESVFGTEYGTDSGIVVNAQTAMMYPPFWQAVQLISSTAAGLPLNHYKRRRDISPTASEWAENSPLDYLVSISPDGGIEPNTYTTSVQFWESFMVNVLIYNHAYAYIAYDGAMRPRQLRLLLPDRTAPERHDGKLYYVTEASSGNGARLIPLQPWEVLHVQGLSCDGISSPPFIQTARNAIAVGLAQQKFASKFFANGGRIGGILELPMGMPKPNQQQTEEGFRKTYEGADNPFKTVILRDNAKFHAAQQSPESAQMVDASEHQALMIARYFNLPPSLLGIKGSVSYNSKEAENQAFLDLCLRRWLQKIAAECNLKLLTMAKQREEFFRHDVSVLLDMDALRQAQSDQIYRSINVLSPNEVRAKMNLLPRDGGDSYDNPNTTPGGQAKEPKDSETPKDNSPPADNTPKPKRMDYRQLRVLFSLTHAARQKARKGQKAFMEWLDGNMAQQRTEWNEISAGEQEPEFFINLSAALNKMVETATPDALTTEVESITTTFEQGI